MEQLRNKQGLTEAEFLARYDAGAFERPSVTVDILIFSRGEDRALKLLLIKRGDHPCIGQWALPGGFINMDESLEESAQRELQEETGLSGIGLEQLYTFGDVGRDPRTRIISTAYLALVDSASLPVRAGDDAAEAQWFTVTPLTLAGLAGLSGSKEPIVLEVELTGNNTVLSGKLRLVRQGDSGLARVERQIIATGGIAFDHAKVILQGLERLKELGLI